LLRSFNSHNHSPHLLFFRYFFTTFSPFPLFHPLSFYSQLPDSCADGYTGLTYGLLTLRPSSLPFASSFSYLGLTALTAIQHRISLLSQTFPCPMIFLYLRRLLILVDIYLPPLTLNYELPPSPFTINRGTISWTSFYI